MTAPDSFWRLHRRFALDDSVESELARRVFPLFLTDWALHGADGRAVVVCLTDYAKVLGGPFPYKRETVARAFGRLVATCWLTEAPGIHTAHGPRRAFRLGVRATAALTVAPTKAA